MNHRLVIALLGAALVVSGIAAVAHADPSADCASLATRATDEALTVLTALGHPDAASTRSSYERQLALGWSACPSLPAEELACLTAAPSIRAGLVSCNPNAGREFPQRLRLPTLTAVAHAMRQSDPPLDEAARATARRDLVGTYVRDDGGGRKQTREFRADGTVHVVQLRSDGTVERDETYRVEVRTPYELRLEEVSGTRRAVWSWLRVGDELVMSDNANDAPVSIGADGRATLWAGPVARVEGLNGASPTCRAFNSEGLEATAVTCTIEGAEGAVRTLTLAYTPPASIGGDGTTYPATRASFLVSNGRIVPATPATRFVRQARPNARR